MAATEHPARFNVTESRPYSSRRTGAGALQALSSAALLLPGILAPAVQAQDAPVEDFSFQFDHFEEGKRDLVNVHSSLDPIRVDVVHGSLNAILTDRLNLHLNYAQDSWSGATPFTTAPLAADGNRAILRDTPGGVIQSGASPYANNRVLLDAARRPYAQQSGVAVADPRTVHILSSASPEIRQQGDATFAYEWQDAGLEIGGGISDEPDFYSRFGSVAVRLDFRQKTTTLKFGTAYTDNEIHAILDSDVVPYLTRRAYSERITRRDGEEILKAGSREWTWHAGLTQVLNRQSLVDFSMGWTQSKGYLASPYKATTVLFVDPALTPGANGLVSSDMRVLMDQRPEERRQWAFSGRYVHYVDTLDAALHLNYQYARDSWGMKAHTAVAQWVQPFGNGWTLTPRLRYYTQSAVDFYTPYMVSEQAYRTLDFEGDEPVVKDFDPGLLPDYFSSDHRLAGFGGVSGSLTLSRELTRGFSFEASVESYRRASSLRAGGEGSGGYADMDFTVVSAGVKLDFPGARTRAERREREAMSAHDSHDHASMSMPGMSSDAHMHALPPGLMFAHTLPNAGDVMMAYRYQGMRQSGDMIDSDGRVDDALIVSQACLPEECRYVPREMSMRMHMLDLMYAPTDWLTLMLMPQLMSMEMDFRELEGRPPATPGEHEHASSGGHRSGGFGDTVVAAIAKLPLRAGGQWHAGLGLSVPTGKVDLELRRMFKIDGGLMHFDMQTGSGTWDLLPSVTYTGMSDRLSWGAQWSAIARLGGYNDSGYRLGDQQQLNAWLSYPVNGALSLSLRSTYTLRDEVDGDFNAYNARLGPMDFPFNQGGRLLEAGIGATVTFPGTSLAGSQLSLEWMAPVKDAPYGVQLERKPMLNASWQYHF